MASTSIVFVDTLAALRIATSEHEGARVIADNPLLAHDPRVGGALEDISGHLDAEEGSHLGHCAIDMLMALDDRLTALDMASRFGARPGPLNLVLVMRSLLATLMQRGVMMARALKAHGPGTLHILSAERPQHREENPWGLDWFVDPYRALTPHGFFGNRRTEVVNVDVALPLFAAINDTAIADHLLRAAIVPLPQLAYEIKRRLGVTRLAWRRGICVARVNEALRETLPWLALRGYRLEPIAVPGYAAPQSSNGVNDPDLGRVVDDVIGGGLSATGSFSKSEVAAIQAVFRDHLTQGLSTLAPTAKRLEETLDHAFMKVKRNRTLITSGVYGPIGRQLISLCREKEIALVDFEHGATTGLARTSERRLRFSEASTCDLLLVSSAGAARSFGQAVVDGKPAIEVVGLADQTRRVFRRHLQRFRARRRLGLRRGEAAIVHVSTLLYGGTLRPGDDAPVEQHVFQTDKTLLTEVYAGLDKTVLYKPYPAQRYPHHAGYDALFELDGNIRMIEWADFRYTRTAADILVTTANSSTIGWCVGAETPLVHLGSRQVNALVDDALRAAFASAFFSIDLDAPDWPSRLRALLTRDVKALRSEWVAKAPARAKLLREGICGPTGSVGRRAARVILDRHA